MASGIAELKREKLERDQEGLEKKGKKRERVRKDELDGE
jgi:hypothetical protein